jgi:hypothetical protein
MRRIGFLAPALGVVFAFAISASSQAQPPPPEFKLPKPVDDVLWWLPEDTETLMVAQGPIALGAQIREIDVDALGLARTIQLMTLAIGDDHVTPELEKTVWSRPIALAVQGSRRFRVPNGFGMMRYEGALILVFQDDLGANGKALEQSLRKQATKTEVLSGVPVATFDGKMVRTEWDVFYDLPGEKAEGEPQPLYVALPCKNTIICASDRDYLTSVLTRMARRAETRAFPASRPEWRHLDPTARTWAIRCFDVKEAPRDGTSRSRGKKAAGSPDNEATGLVFWVDPANRNNAKIKYLSANKNDRALARGYWDYPETRFIRKIQQEAPGIVDISIATEKPDGERDVAGFLLLLLNALGHGPCP